MMNFIGSFFGSFATAGALSRSILQDTSGGNTQVWSSSLTEDNELNTIIYFSTCSWLASSHQQLF